ncbi:MAG TPA: glycosyltransferase family 2 protein [Chryseosolibacter sp.]
MVYLFEIVDSIVFAYLGFSVIYFFVFAVFSMFNRKDKYPEASEFHRFLVLFPAYREDRVIESSIKDFLRQTYPRDRYEVVVISDQMSDETNRRISNLPVRLLNVNFTESSKGKALIFAMDCLKDNEYDVVVILDADNTVEPDFLDQLNRVYDAGVLAIQGNRQGKNLHTDYAIMDAASEAMNNAYFRKGHSFVGLSSSLSGSGMAFDYKWFQDNIRNISTNGEDLEFEIFLLKQRIFIEYLSKVPVYDEKVQNATSFSRQRRRWLSAQVDCLKIAIRDLPNAIFSGNINYADKLLQWLMLPRVLLLGFVFLITIIVSLVKFDWALKWWALLLILVITFWIAIPKTMNVRLLKIAVKRVPLLFGLMFVNLFHVNRASGKVFHTPHGGPASNTHDGG